MIPVSVKQRLALVLATVLLGGCNQASRLAAFELTGATMGTRFSVTLVAPPDDLEKDALQADIETLLASIEQRTSTYLDQSEISTFNASASTDWIKVSRELCEIVADSLAISRRVGGAFDVTAGPLVNLWGFGPDDLRAEPPSDEDIATARERVGYRKLHTDCSRPVLRKDHPDLYVDLSAYAKGYAVDRIADLLRDRGVANFLVEIGGELRMQGHNASTNSWTIAVENPLADGGTVHSVLQLTDAAVATSGDYHNYFDYAGQRYSHVIDTRLGGPVSHPLASVTVVSESTAFADAMATALFAMGPEEGFEFARRDGLAVFFLVRSGAGVNERMTREFESLQHP